MHGLSQPATKERWPYYHKYRLNKESIVCFTGCGEAGKVNDKTSDAVKPLKGAQQHKEKDNDRIIINIARKDLN